MSDTDNSGIIASMKTAEVDQRFVGIWSGTDDGKFFKGETNSWMVNRRSDGTMTVNFKTIHTDDRVTFSEDEGIWCVLGEDYYEFRESDEKPDHYTYLFMSKDSIHFIINEELKEEETYNFIDNRIYLD